MVKRWRDVKGKGIVVSDDVRPLDRRKLSINDHGERWMETSTSSWLHEKVPLFSQGPPEQQHRQVQLLRSYFPITLYLLTNTSVVKEAATAAFCSPGKKLSFNPGNVDCLFTFNGGIDNSQYAAVV